VRIIKKGYTLIEVIISITILAFISPLFIFVIKQMVNFSSNNTQRQNFIGIIQLRRSLSLGVKHIIESDQICMTYNDDLMCFEQYESNLIAYPGTQYFLVKVDDINFFNDEGWIMLEFESESKNYVVKLIKL
jgi:prepilin-type N-terminal cleavage/methylation domain-containing protein